MPHRYRTKQMQLLFYSAAIMCCLTSAARADTIMLNPFKDNSLINNSTGSLSNGKGPLFSGLTGGAGPGALRALLAFDIASSIPAESTITDVQLTLNILQAGSGSANSLYTLHRTTQNWGEGTSTTSSGSGAASTTGDATWTHTFFNGSTWTNPGGDFEASPSASKSIGTFGPEVWGSTTGLVADVQSWLDTPSSNFGWILIGDESVSATARKFASRELNNSPLLSITFIPVPEPGALSLALLGSLYGIISTRRRQV